MSIPPSSLIVAGPIYTNAYSPCDQGTHEWTMQMRIDDFVVTICVWTRYVGTDHHTHRLILRHIPRIPGNDLTIEPATTESILTPQPATLLVSPSPNLILMTLVPASSECVYVGLPSKHVHPTADSMIHRDSLLVTPQAFLGYGQIMGLLACQCYPLCVYLKCIIHRLNGVVDNVVHVLVPRRIINEAEWNHTSDAHVGCHIPFFHHLLEALWH
ncbi:hypothetical protein FISHEDRAFT_77151 [Fistulina hepatica ATCC 64428]|uniref:Uncharacterized protein n=1 Tax=Fistulina hepatica ATCC 64428 TaxID=1128425 RepID=A0A0D7A1N7_9AGAR|nr:hypothetical protein FISHEDRAFT_77151 [Fistulina hepatica ATCC 64428]